MTEPFWLSVGRAFIGLAEVPGAASSPVIAHWARDIGAPAWYDDDDKPWCAVFLNRVMLACQLPMSGTGFELLRAASFESWGVPTTPRLGAILVFARPEGRHVGLYCGETDTAYHVLGGNQGNAVSLAWIDKARLSACRWPSGLEVDTPRLMITDAGTVEVSQNEA